MNYFLIYVLIGKRKPIAGMGCLEFVISKNNVQITSMTMDSCIKLKIAIEKEIVKLNIKHPHRSW